MLFPAIRQRGRDWTRCLSAFAWIGCFLCVEPAVADVLSPYAVPSAHPTPYLLSTRSNTEGMFPVTLTPDQIADPHGAKAFIGINSNFYEVFVSRVAEVAVLGDEALQAFALRYANGSVQLATPTSLVESFQFSSEWLTGPYAAMANGYSHLCFLRESGFVECRAASAPVSGFNVSSGVLMDHRSVVRFTQITAANCFTCALRANDSKVECYGDVVVDWTLFRPAPFRVALTSSLLQYSVIAAELAGAWCGLTLDAAGRDLYCWSFSSPTEVLTLPAPTAPLFWRTPFFSIEVTHGCAIRNDGRASCNITDDLGGYIALPPLIAQIPLSELTLTNRRFKGAAATTGNIVEYTGGTSTVLFGVFAFTPIRMIGVDAVHGNDTLCNSASTLSLPELRALIPCATLAGALAQLTRRNTWIQLLPGTHYGGDAAIEFVDVTLSSQPPSCLTQTELAAVANGSWIQRMAEAAALNSVALLNCTGFVNCVTSDYARLSLIGLSFTGASEHAITHTIPPEHVIAEVDCSVINCRFFQIGGMLQKNNGQLLVRGCVMSEALQSNAVRALLDLFEVTTMLESSTFAHNVFLPDFDDFYYYASKSCVSLVAMTGLPATIDGCTFADNHANTVYSVGFIGGVAIQIRMSGSTVRITNSNFTDQSTHAPLSFGGAIGVYVPPPLVDLTTPTSLLVQDCNFESCSSVSTRDEGSAGGGGGCISVSEDDPTSSVPIASGAAVTVRRCTFRNSRADPVGGAIRIGSAITSLTIETIELRNCSAQKGGGIWIGHARTRQLLFGQSASMLSGITAIGCSAVLTGGSVTLEAVSTSVQFTQCRFEDSRSAGTGGALSILVGQGVILFNVQFARTFAETQGGAIYMTNLGTMDFTQVDFENSSALLSGGAVHAQFTVLLISETTFIDCNLLASVAPVSVSTSKRAGGAIRLVGGSMLLLDSSFLRCTALPNSMALSSCADSYDAVSGMSVEGTGGSVSLELSYMTLSNVAVSQGRACTGGFVSMNGADIATEFDQLVATQMEAWSGSVFAIRATSSVRLTHIRVNNSLARSNGGAIVLTEDGDVALVDSAFANVSCTPLHAGAICDGGTIWISGQNRLNLDAHHNSFSDVTAAGAGAVLFRSLSSVTAAALVNALPLSDLRAGNTFAQTGPPPFAQYGQVQASSIMNLTAGTRRLELHPGQLLDALLPIVTIVTLDAFGQAGTMDRSLVVAIEAVGAGASAVSFAGTILQKVQAASGAANFSSGDLRISAPPGDYTLRFSVVSLPDLTVDVALSVLDSCPTGLFYSVDLRSCVACPSDLVAYNATSNACEQCLAGWQRSVPSAPNATGGPLNDGVFCEVCPLGSVSTSGSRCAPCPPNTYQPTPFATCVQCSEIAGLQCAGDGLAQVEAGFFALSVPDGAGGSLIETFQCPEGFCSAARVQVTAASAVSANLAAPPPLSSSAVNSYEQCAFPRLASPSNLLCGECAEGYRPWGNKCDKCDSVDGGLLFGLVVLSLVLLGWLIRSSLGSPSAGHAVVVLYFVQTAMLELGSLNNLLAWLNVVLLSPNSVGRCVAPLTPYQQTQAQILMPVALWIELCIIALIHFLAFRRWGALFAREPAADANTPFGARVRASALLFISQFSVDVYISATLSLLLFTYTQVAVACVSYLRCVDVGGTAVVFSQPSMRCGSDEYARTKVLVILALVIYIAGLPIGIAAFLWRRSGAVRDAHSALAVNSQVDGAGRIASAPIASDSTDAVSPSPAPSASTARFLRCYAPLFAMYSSSAWFWQVVVLCRRTVFVVISVTLLPTPRRRFVAFALSTLLSLLLQLFVNPFRMAIFNRAESASHSLLIILSITLTSEDPPFSEGVNAFVFLIVVPPLCLYAVWAAGTTIIGVRVDRDRLFALKEREQLELEASIDLDANLTRNPSLAIANPHAARSIEMSAATNQADSGSAAASDIADRARL